MGQFPNQPVRRRSGIPWYEVLDLAPGKSCYGWVSGPPVATDTHWVAKKVGCREALTGGALECWHCRAQMARVSTVYVPLWDEYGARWLAVIGPTYGEQAKELEHNQYVKVTKVLRNGCPLRADVLLSPPSGPRLTESDKVPQDLEPWLLRAWGDEELEAWFAARSKSDNAVSLVTPTHVITPTPALRQAAEDAQGAAEKAHLRRLQERSKLPPTIGELEPQVNGKHRKRK